MAKRKDREEDSRFTNFRCPAELKAWAQIHAIKEGITLAEVLIRALRQYRKSEQERKREEREG